MGENNVSDLFAVSFFGDGDDFFFGDGDDFVGGVGAAMAGADLIAFSVTSFTAGDGS